MLDKIEKYIIKESGMNIEVNCLVSFSRAIAAWYIPMKRYETYYAFERCLIHAYKQNGNSLYGTVGRVQVMILSGLIMKADICKLNINPVIFNEIKALIEANLLVVKYKGYINLLGYINLMLHFKIYNTVAFENIASNMTFNHEKDASLCRMLNHHAGMIKNKEEAEKTLLCIQAITKHRNLDKLPYFCQLIRSIKDKFS